MLRYNKRADALLSFFCGIAKSQFRKVREESPAFFTGF
jgi:hypothetical protein